jgi:hypothetical protein
VYQVSSDFKREILDGASLITVGDVYRGDPYSSPLLTDVPIVSGTITADPDAVVRRRCSLEIGVEESPDLYVPAQRYSNDQGFWPSGNEINIRQGVKYRNGTLGTEWVNLGWFTISNPRVKDNGQQLTLSVEGSDMGRRIGRWKLNDDYDIPAGLFVPAAVQRVLMATMPTLGDADFDFDEAMQINTLSGGVNALTPHLILSRNDNVWEKMCKLCRWNGMDLDITVDKKIRIRPLPNPLWEEPDAVYEEGEFNIVTDYERILDDENAINGVIIIGENSSNPTIVRGEAWDTNPFSPTFFDPANPGSSRYGRNPKIVSVNWVSSNDVAQLVATYELIKASGIVETVNISALSMFCHEPYDIVQLKRARAGIDAEYMINSMTLGLGSDGALQANTRQRERIHWSGSELG